jgi:signal transduction histidine kinase
LIALGPRARWPVAIGVIAATILANLMGDRNLAAAVAFALANAAESLIVAGLIHRTFGPSFNLGQLRDVLRLLAAAIAATAISGIGGAIAYKLFHSPAVPVLLSWGHWFASDAVGIIAVAPLIIGIATSIRRPPVRREIPEALAALGALTATTILIIALPQQAWETVVPVALLAPSLLWLAARFRPVYSAVGSFMVSFVVIGTVIHGLGHFGGPGVSTQDRILQAQIFVAVVMVGALVMAALFAECRSAEARLLDSNMLLERERDKNFMNVEVVTAAIVHEIRQPLSAIVLEGGAGLIFLERTPPDHQSVHESISSMIASAHYASEVIDGIRNLFRRVDEGVRPTDVNEIILAVLGLLRGELQRRGVVQRIHLTPELPPVLGNRNQLHEVILNLVHNSLEAMDGAPDRGELRVRTELRGTDAILVTVQDSGPGIDGDKLEKIFDAFFTTKKTGMGLGLAMCRMIIERHGGQLTASSDGKTGALFSIVVPTEPSHEGRRRGRGPGFTK